MTNWKQLVKFALESAEGSNKKRLSNAFWDERTGVVVIHDPRAHDQGTAFVPRNEKAYFDGLR